jgi:hypothetical protein
VHEGTVVTTEASDSTYMSTDGSMVRLLLKEEPIAACGRLVTGTNYPTLFLAKPQDNPSIGRRLNPQDATVYTYINAQDDYLYHSSKGGKLEERNIIRAEFCHRSQQQRLTAYDFPMSPEGYTHLLTVRCTFSKWLEAFPAFTEHGTSLHNGRHCFCSYVSFRV